MERCINKIRAWRGLATRYDKTPASYMAGLQLRGSIIWMRSLNPGPRSRRPAASRTPQPRTSGRRGDRPAEVPGKEPDRAVGLEPGQLLVLARVHVQRLLL